MSVLPLPKLVSLRENEVARRLSFDKNQHRRTSALLPTLPISGLAFGEVPSSEREPGLERFGKSERALIR
jgi:hypothetical protein